MSSKSGKKKTGYSEQQHLDLVRGGKPYFDCLLQLIDQSTQYFHLQTYIFDEDETGLLVASHLKQAAWRGVKVMVLVDGYASQHLSKTFVSDLRQAGVRFRFFEPIFKRNHFYFGRRLHHKVAVADGQQALVGGVNIADKYNDLPGKPSWLDFAVFIEGKLARELCVVCWKTWKGFPVRTGRIHCGPQISHNLSAEMQPLLARMRRNDWVRAKNQISKSYIEMLSTAQTEVNLLCSYFLPGRILRRVMQLACRRGVKINVIMAGLSDVPMAKHAERYLYDWLLRNNINIYEYQQRVLHGKVATCDSKWMTVGSYNVNNVSAYASIELNIDVLHEGKTKQLEELLKTIMELDCEQVTYEKHLRSKTWLVQLLRWASYELIRIIFYLFTFYFKQKVSTTRR
jgi:cardiolipin synthase